MIVGTGCDDQSDIIRRLATLVELDGPGGLEVIPWPDGYAGGTVDAVLLDGAVRLWPSEQRRRIIEPAVAALAPGGELIVLVGPDGAGDRAEQDGEEAEQGQWLEDFLPPPLALARFQRFGDGRAYGVRRHAGATPPEPFLDVAEMRRRRTVQSLPLSEWGLAAARADGLHSPRKVTTEASTGSYAILSPHLTSPSAGPPATGVYCDLTLHQGAIALNVLDLARDVFVAPLMVVTPGRHQIVLPVSFPEVFQIIVSNFHPDAPGISVFSLHEVSLIAVARHEELETRAEENWRRRLLSRHRDAPAEPDPALRVFGDDDDWFSDLVGDPARRIPELAHRLRRLAREMTAGERVAWFSRQPGANQGGLTGAEVTALLQPWFFIETVDEIDRGDRGRLIGAVARIRRDEVMLIGRLGRVETGLEALHALATAVRDLEVPGIAVMMTRDQAIEATKILGGSLADSLLAGLRRSVPLIPMKSGGGGPDWLGNVCERISFGLRVPADRIDPFLKSPAAEYRPLEGALPSGALLRAVQIDPPPATVDAARLSAGLRAAGLPLDLSFSSDRPRRRLADIGHLTGSYFRSGSYFPQDFDRRTPRAVVGDDIGVVSIRHPGRHLTDVSEWCLFWEERLNPRTAELARLLDFRRREKYSITAGSDPLSTPQNQWHNEFHLLHWPKVEPARRLTVIDVGEIDQPGLIQRILTAGAAFVRTQGETLALVSPAAALEIARAEAAGRGQAANADILKEQLAAHDYLASASTARRDAPLSPLLLDFCRQMPAKLGLTLEIGAGFGQLAFALSPRAQGYVCLDLNPDGFRALEPARGEYGLVCDVLHLAFADATFDSIVANNVLEHMGDPVRALRELARVLRDGGSCFALIPLDALEADFCLEQHLWKADSDSVKSVVAAAGLALSHFSVVDGNLAGVYECYPSCRGLYAKVVAAKPRTVGWKGLSALRRSRGN